MQQSRKGKGEGKGKASFSNPQARAGTRVPPEAVSGLKVACLRSQGLAESALAEVGAHFEQWAPARGSSQMFEIGWSFLAWDREGKWSRAKPLDEFPHLRSLLTEAMLCLTDRADLNERSLNVIVRQYTRGQGLKKHTDRRDAFGEDVFGCVLANTSDQALEFEERSRSDEVLRWTSLNEQSGACFLQRGDARNRWIHGVERLSHGQRVSVSWRWFSQADSGPQYVPTPQDSQPEDGKAKPSELSEHEKAFLKSCKLLRDILTLEEQKANGEKLMTNQEQKLNKKSAALKDVQDKLENLAVDAPLRQKNQDVIRAATAAAEPQRGVYSDDKALPSVSAVESAADVKTATTQAPATVEPQVDDDFEKNHADGKPGKLRGKRGGVSHNVRKCNQRQVAGG